MISQCGSLQFQSVGKPQVFNIVEKAQALFIIFIITCNCANREKLNDNNNCENNRIGPELG